MGGRVRSVVSIAVGTIALVVAGGVAPEPAAAAIGDIFVSGGTVNLKQEDGVTALCPPVNISGIGNGITGTSVDIVRGGALGLFDHRVLLVTSCLGASSDTTRKRTIHFVDPETGNSVHSIATTFIPPRGWSGIAFRPDKGDFIGCVATGSNTGNLEIYKISYTGSTALIVNSAIGALKGPVCDGLAWDYDTKTIYAGKDGGTTVRSWVSASNNDSFAQVSPDLTSPLQVPLGGGAPKSCLTSGLAFVDGALFVACQALSSGSLSSVGHLVNKSSGANLSALPLFDQTIAEDIACDAVTFQAQNRDALWAKNRTTNVVNAFELPGFTCGRSIGPIDPVTSNPLVTLVTPSFKGPGACPGSTPDADTDGDGLLDCWEDPTLWTDGQPGIDWDGVWNGNVATRDVLLCVNGVCADKLQKDIFVEVDSMDLHPFDATARQQVIDAFGGAPVSNPGGTPGVRLHILADDGNAPGSDVIAHQDFVALEPCTPPAGGADAKFDEVKKTRFGTKAERSQAEPQKGKTIFAKRMAFRWALFAHDLKPPGSNPGARSSGCAEIEGDDLVVTLGSVFAGTLVVPPPHVNGNVNDQAGTFMHELGHTLGLRHGGNDGVNCKPQQLSVMTYTRQFSDGVPLTARRLDYSRGAVTLNEAGLNEAAGIGTPNLPTGVTDEVVFAADKVGGGRVAVIWPAGPNIDWNNNASISGIVANDVNNFDFPDSEVSGCDSLLGETLGGYDEWANLQYNHRASLDVASGASNEVKDPVDGLQAVFESVDVNSDGFTDARCPATGQLWVIDIQSPMQLNQIPGGDTQVKFFSQPGCIVAFLNPATLTLAGSSGIKGRVKQKNNGTFNCSTPDLNQDGRPDLVCHMDDSAFVVGDVVGVAEGETLAGSPSSFGFRARAEVEVQ